MDLTVNVSKMMKPALPREVMFIIKRLAGLADERRVRAYIVGGFVRDLLMGIKNLDIDLAIEGDGIDFAGYAADKLNAALVTHKRFGTATLLMKRRKKNIKFKIDIATARTEIYRYLAALPSVRFGSIRDDLYRRDFTINAMAVSINKKNFGELVDFFGGRNDLKMRKIKVLHDGSFMDDPTRIFRAVRFEQRYDFNMDRRTASLIRSAVKMEMFDKVSGERLRAEVELLLKEDDPIKAIKRMRNLHELRFISPRVRFDAGFEKACKNARKLHMYFKKYFPHAASPDIWLVYFMAIIDRLTLRESLQVCDRFVMRRSERLSIISCKKYGEKSIKLLSRRKAVKASELYKALKPLPYEALIFLTAKCGSGPAKKRVTDFITRHNNIRLKIKGPDLKRLGVKPGPDFTMILKKTLYAKIDGLLKTKKDELFFAGKLIGKK